ncbi:hypothetical protein L917_03024 [Phytophthora nicotianae]|uniref:Uncharacterized protein n=1 Tax=Phytophthora nicotianae TaxID=4792 RepID=W2LUB9_PHYNI|nr:hypothetical protein L917_03024 [Phytophthora nicotianae]
MTPDLGGRPRRTALARLITLAFLLLQSFHTGHRFSGAMLALRCHAMSLATGIDYIAIGNVEGVRTTLAKRFRLPLDQVGAVVPCLLAVLSCTGHFNASSSSRDPCNSIGSAR